MLLLVPLAKVHLLLFYFADFCFILVKKKRMLSFTPLSSSFSIIKIYKNYFFHISIVQFKYSQFSKLVLIHLHAFLQLFLLIFKTKLSRQANFLFLIGVAPTILQLLQCAIVANAPGTNAGKKTEGKQTTSRKEREKSDDSAAEALFEEAHCLALVEQINKQVTQDIFTRFIKAFVLESNSTSIRWQAHSLFLAVYK